MQKRKFRNLIFSFCRFRIKATAFILSYPSSLYSKKRRLFLSKFAEFDNFKKRTAREKQEIGSFAKGACIKELLGVADNFERALSTECKDEDFYKGMEMILKQMQDTFTRLGATEIEALNMPFNPEMHHAIKQVEDESFGENTVCQVLQKGYTLDGHVIRHAMVVVANP